MTNLIIPTIRANGSKLPTMRQRFKKGRDFLQTRFYIEIKKHPCKSAFDSAEAYWWACYFYKNTFV